MGWLELDSREVGAPNDPTLGGAGGQEVTQPRCRVRAELGSAEVRNNCLAHKSWSEGDPVAGQENGAIGHGLQLNTKLRATS